MTKITFKDLPSLDTPLSAENLNKLNNIIIDLNAENHEEEVVLIKSNNLANTTIEQGAINGTTGVPYSETTRIRTSNFIYVKPNVMYAINWKENLSAFILFYKSDGTYLNNIGSWKTKGSNFTIPNEANLIKIIWKDSSNDGTTLTSNSISEFMMNEGTSALSYKPCKTSTINANNDKYTDTVNIGIEPYNCGLFVKYSKNLFDKSLITSTTDTIKYIPMQVEKNTNYTLSTNSGTSTQAHVFLTTSASGASSANNGAMINKPRTVNSGENSILYIAYNSDLANYWIQFQKGSEATTFEPYIASPSIKINNNGIYETVANKNVYSTNEVVIGEWLGKPLYRKTISFGALPNNTEKTFTTDLPNTCDIQNIYGRSKNTNKSVLLIPYSSLTLTNQVALNIWTSGGKYVVGITTGKDRSDYTDTYVVLEYTKSTDTGISTYSDDEEQQ